MLERSPREIPRSASYLLSLAEEYLLPGALRAVAQLGVADHLENGPRTSEQLADAVGADAGRLHRALRALATRGVFEEKPAGVFRLTESGSALRSDSPESVRAAVLMVTDPTLWRPAGEMSHALTGGSRLFESIFGMPFFEYVGRTPESAALFHDGMATISARQTLSALLRYPVPESATIVDVGGGRGSVLRELLRAHPAVRGILVDQKHVLADHWLDEPATLGRWEIQVGDFFETLPEGDLLVLKNVLHDWDDDSSARILRNCRQALLPGGRVLVVEYVVPTGNDPHPAKYLDLMMMGSLHGKERTEEEFTEVFAAAGLRIARVFTDGTAVSMIEGEPVEN